MILSQFIKVVGAVISPFGPRSDFHVDCCLINITTRLDPRHNGMRLPCVHIQNVYSNHCASPAFLAGSQPTPIHQCFTFRLCSSLCASSALLASWLISLLVELELDVAAGATIVWPGCALASPLPPPAACIVGPLCLLASAAVTPPPAASEAEASASAALLYTDCLRAAALAASLCRAA